MAIAYKSKVFSNSAANTSQALFTAVASNTLVKSIICNNDGKSTGTATLRINESGGTSKLIRRVTIASGDTSVELLYDVLALEAGDILYVTSTDTDITFIMSYAEDSEALVLQSIDVLSDVNTTGKADGDVLTWDDGTNNWVALPSTGGGATTLDGLTDVTIVDPLDHDSLIYDEATSQWINGAPKAFDLPVYSASAIVKGKLLKAVGAQGDKISVGLFDLDVDDPKNLIGLSVDAISAGGTGHARVFGELRGISTNSYSIGTILYASGTAGDLSSTAGVPEIPVAMVIRSQLNTGRLFVRTWVPTASKVYSVNGNTGSVILDAADIYRVGSSGDTIDTDLTAAENSINEIKAVLKYPSSSLTGLQVNTTNKLEIDSTTQKAVFTINGSSAATIGPSQSLFPQVRIGTTGDTYDLPITRGSNDGEVPVYTATTNTSEWRTLQTSNLAGTSDGITQGTTNLFLTSAEQTKLAGVATGAEVNQNAFSNVAVSGQTTVAADAKTDTLTLAAANSNIVLTTDAPNDTVTIGLASLPSIDGLIVGSTGIVSASGNLSLVTGDVSCVDITASGTSNLSTVVVSSSLTTTGISFTGGGTSTIGPDNSLPSDPSDLLIRSNGNVDVVLDYDDNESSQAFRVKDGDGNTMFSVDEDGISVANGTASTGAVLRLGEATANGTNYVAVQAPASLAASTTFTLPSADGVAGQSITTNGSGTLTLAHPFSQVTTNAGIAITLSLSDAGKYIRCTGSTAITVTIPQNVFEIGHEILLEQNNTGQVTIAAGTGVTLRNSSNFLLKTSEQYSIIGLKCVAANEFILTGEREIA